MTTRPPNWRRSPARCGAWRPWLRAVRPFRTASCGRGDSRTAAIPPIPSTGASRPTTTSASSRWPPSASPSRSPPSSWWDPLSGPERDRLARWLLSALHREVPDNNWHFFPVLVGLGLDRVGSSTTASPGHRASRPPGDLPARRRLVRGRPHRTARLLRALGDALLRTVYAALAATGPAAPPVSGSGPPLRPRLPALVRRRRRRRAPTAAASPTAWRRPPSGARCRSPAWTPCPGARSRDYLLRHLRWWRGRPARPDPTAC